MKHKQKIMYSTLVFLGLISVCLSGCIDNPSTETIGVLVTIVPQAEMVEYIAGEFVNVTIMVPAGQDPHSFEPTPEQMTKVADATAYFKVGSGVEFEVIHMDTILEQNSELEVFDCSEDITVISFDAHFGHEEHHDDDHENETGHDDDDHENGDDDHGDENGNETGHDDDDHGEGDDDHDDEENGHEDDDDHEEGDDDHHDDHDHNGTDPHIWLSPENFKKMAENVYNGLVEIDPENQEEYNKNYQSYIQKLDSLHTNITTLLEPYENNSFMVYHPAWGYFGDTYHLHMLAIEDEGKQPGPGGIDAIITQAQEHNITVIFVAPQFDTSNAETIADEINGEVVFANPLMTDYEETLTQLAEDMVTGFENS